MPLTDVTNDCDSKEPKWILKTRTTIWFLLFHFFSKPSGYWTKPTTSQKNLNHTIACLANKNPHKIWSGIIIVNYGVWVSCDHRSDCVCVCVIVEGGAIGSVSFRIITPPFAPRDSTIKWHTLNRLLMSITYVDDERAMQ